jgi:hypothetical protein
MTADQFARAKAAAERIAEEARQRRNGQATDDYLPPDDEPPDENQASTSLLSGMFSAADLDGMSFDPLVEHIPHLVTEGFGILAGPPKIGKSWLVNGFSLACAQGTWALGAIGVEKRPVLLLALEDGQRRLQDRLTRLNDNQPLPDMLDIITTATLGTVSAIIAEWLEVQGNSQPPLVVLDTLGRARPQRTPGADPYIADYQLGVKIKAIIDKFPGAALLATHHTRKMAAVDWLETVSGTQGIAGSADYALVLHRKRKSNLGSLAVTGATSPKTNTR